MAVDRGGLRYTITVEDRFSKQISNLKTKLKSLQGDLDRVSAARARMAASANASASATSASAAAAQRAGRAQASAGRQTVTAQRNTQRALQGTQRQLTRTSRAAKRSIVDVNNLGFSFRRLIGIFAVFQAARLGANLFSGAVAGGVQFNATVESAQIAMASLFTTVGRIEDSQGNLVTGAKAFALAQGIAAEQTRLLRIDAIQTTATFEELQKAFQSGIGPGLEAGLSIDEIRNVTVRISQAASALNIQQNQLTEEIRSLLRGTIQARTTVVASVLGITNADIKRVKQAGTLAEFLREKLDGFRFAALATQQSFAGLSARLRDTFSVATGAAAEDFFGELKVTLGEISSLFVTLERDAKGAVTSITPDPGTVFIFRQIFDALSEGVVILREGLAQITFNDLASSFAGLGGIFRVLAAAGAGLIQGLIAGFGLVSRAIGGAIDAVGGLETILPIVEQVAVFLAKWGTLIFTAVTGLSIAGKVLQLTLVPARLLIDLFNNMASAAFKIAGGIAAIPLPLLAVIAAISVGVVLLNDWIKKVAGFQVRIGTLGRIIKEGLFNVLVLVAAKIQEIFLGTFVSTVVKAVQQAIGGTINILRQGLSKIASILNKSGITSPIADQIGALAGNLAKAEGTFTILSQKTDAFVASLKAATADAAKQVIDDFDAAIADDNTAFDLGASITENVDKAVEALKKIVGPNLVDEEEIRKAVEQAIVKGAQQGGEGAVTPLQKFAQNIVKNFDSGLQIMRQLTNQFATFVADLVVDAFDPNKKVDLKQRFATLFQGIVKAIIAELVKLAIAKAILKITGAAEGGQQGKAQGGQLGFDSGGVVPGGHHSTPAFRPASVAKSDTVNAWLTPKEFVQPVRAVNKYGADLMEMMRRGAIDPAALRSVAGLGGKRASRIVSSSSHRGGGYATGGSVSSSDQAAVASTAGTGGDGQVVGAVIPGNDRTMDRLLQGGKNSMLDFFQDNSSTIDSILSKNRQR